MISYGHVIVVDDFFSSCALSAIEQKNYLMLNYMDERKSGIAKRVKTEIQCPEVDSELEGFIKSDELATQIKDWPDLAWRYVWNGLVVWHEVAISEYDPNGGMDWHIDHYNRKAVLNWIVSISGKAFIEWNTDPFPKALPEIFRPSHGSVTAIDLEPNMLVLMPSYYPHRICMGDEKRVSVHGHFNIRE